MTQQLVLPEDHSGDKISSLEKEIALLEKELQKAESDLNVFEAQLRTRLQSQILRIRELTALYKKQKQEKKAKRLEQKKRGKNYREPQGVTRASPVKDEDPSLHAEDRQELKRLYKEAIVHVHPDKFAGEDPDKVERATAVTVQLNTIYKSGNLDELNDFYEHIVSGNAMSHIVSQPQSIKDPKAMQAFLKKKKEELASALEQIKQSPAYVVLTTYEQPLAFIDELRLQFEQRIRQMEKRTRTK